MSAGEKPTTWVLRVLYFAMGVLLIASSLHVSRRLILDRDLLVLAAVSPALLAALAFGALLLAHVVRSWTQ